MYNQSWDSLALLCCAQSLQSCLTLCDTIHHSPPASSVHGILQARILEWVAMPSSRGIFLTQGSNPHLPCLLCYNRFFTAESLGKPQVALRKRETENQTKEIANIYHVLQCINLPTVFESGYYLLFSSTFYTQESHSTERLRNLPLYVIQQVSPESRFKFRESDSGAQELNHSSRVSPSGLQCWFLSLLLWCVWFSVSFGAYYLLTFIR